MEWLEGKGMNGRVGREKNEWKGWKGKVGIEVRYRERRI